VGASLMSAKSIMLIVLVAAMASAAADFACAETKLVDTTWVSYQRECAIRTLKFISANQATLEVTWQVSGGEWTLKDDKLHIDFEFNATLDGAVKSDNEIEAIFNWVSRDFHVPHKDACALKRKAS
jgi:hypothetical protein